MMDWLAPASLGILLFMIVIGFTTKMNMGIIAIALALILAKLSGITDATVIKGFNYSLFFILAGVTLLFSIVHSNGSLGLFAKKVLALCGSRSYLVPVFIFILSTVLSAIGPGTIPIAALMTVLSVEMAIQMQVQPIKLLPFAILGANAGGLSAITPTGIIAIFHAEQNGITGIELPLLLGMMLSMGAYAAILYFVFGWHRIRLRIDPPQIAHMKFNRKQIITLSAVILMILIVLLFQINVGLAAFLVSAGLLLLRVADERKAISGIPLGTLLMVAGVGVLMNLVLLLGGIDILADFLASIMNSASAAPLITVISGMLSWFSSASGVVLPTMIPTIPNIASSVAGIHSEIMVICICAGAHAAALSPLSTLGALGLAASSSMIEDDTQKRNKVFAQLFILSIFGVLFVTLVAFVITLALSLNVIR